VTVGECCAWISLPLIVCTFAGTFSSGVPTPTSGVVPTTMIEGSSVVGVVSAGGVCAHAATVMLANAPPKTSRSPARGLNGCAGARRRGMLFIIVSSLYFDSRAERVSFDESVA